jgi:hypothetical protein
VAADPSSTVIEEADSASGWIDDDDDDDCAEARPCDIAIAIVTSKTVVIDVDLIS